MSNHLSDHLQEQYEDFRMLARRATLESLNEPDWELNTQCVNIVKDVTDTALLVEITQMLRRRLREPQIRVIVLTLYLIDALAHNCGHALLLAFNDEQFMQQIGSVARKYYITPAEASGGSTPALESRHEVVSVCLELLSNWSQFFRPHSAYYGNIVDMYDILESEGITANASLSFAVSAQGGTARTSPSMQSQSLDAADARSGKPSGSQTNRSHAQSHSDATTSATVFTYDQSGVRRTESESAAESLFPTTIATRDASGRAERSNADAQKIQRTESAPQASGKHGGRGGAPLQRSKSKSGDEMHPKKTSAVAQVPLAGLPGSTGAYGSIDTFDEAFFHGGPTEDLSRYHSPKLDIEGIRDEPDMQSKSDGSSSDITRLSSGEAGIAAADGKGVAVHAHKLSGIPESINESSFGVSGDFLNDSQEILSPEDLQHHSALQSSLSAPRAAAAQGKFVPPPMQKKVSPAGPAQKALDEFLKKNLNTEGFPSDIDLQEELLNQVEIEKRIQQNRSKDPSPTQSTPAPTPGGMAARFLQANNSAEKLQVELEHQHEIERSIREQQHLHRLDAFYGSQSYVNLKDSATDTRPQPDSPRKGYPQYAYDKNYPPQRDADAQYLYDLQSQMQLQEQYASTQKTHAAKASKPKKLKGTNRSRSSGRSASDSDSSEYDGQLIDYADGTNKDFFFVGNTNTYIDTEKRSRHGRHHHQQAPGQGGKAAQDYSYPTQGLPYQQHVQMTQQGYYGNAPSSHTRSSSNSSSIPTTATTTTGTTSSHTAFDQQVEIQKQIFQEYERKKHSKRAPDVNQEAAEARERLLRQQESLLSASVDSWADGQKSRSRSHKHSKHDNARAVDMLTRKSTQEMSTYAEEVMPPQPMQPVQQQRSSRHAREVPAAAALKDEAVYSPPRRERKNSTDSPILGDTTASISAASALRREKGKREEREREIELEWEREQERAVELEKERERALELERQKKKADEAMALQQKQSSRHHRTSQQQIELKAIHEAEHSFSGAAMSGREAAAPVPEFNPFPSSPADAIIIVRGGSAVSDLTCSTIDTDSGPEHDEEREAARLEKASPHVRERAYFEPIDAQPQGPVSMAPAQAVSEPLASSALSTSDPLLQSVALLLREALDPNAAAAPSSSAAPALTSAPAIAGTVDRAKALAAARLLISTLLGQPTPEDAAALVAPADGRSTDAAKAITSQQASPLSEPTKPQSHNFEQAAATEISVPNDSSTRAARAQPVIPPLPLGRKSAFDPAADVLTERTGSFLLDDADGMYNSYENAYNSSNTSTARARPPVLLDADLSELAEMSSTKSQQDVSPGVSAKIAPPKMEPYPQRLLDRDALPPKPASPAAQGVPPLSPMKSRKENEDRPPQSRKPASESSQQRMRQSEMVLQALEEVTSVNERYVVPDAPLQSDESIRPSRKLTSGDIGMPQSAMNRNTVAMQSGISVITETTYDSGEHRRDRERGRTMSRSSKLTRSSSVAAGEREARPAETRPALTRSASMEPRPRKPNIDLVIDPSAPYDDWMVGSRQNSPGSRLNSPSSRRGFVEEGLIGTPRSSASRKPAVPTQAAMQEDRRLKQATQEQAPPRSSGGRHSRSSSRDNMDMALSHKSVDASLALPLRSPSTRPKDSRPTMERLPENPYQRSGRSPKELVKEPRKSSSRQTEETARYVEERVEYREERDSRRSVRDQSAPAESSKHHRTKSRDSIDVFSEPSRRSQSGASPAAPVPDMRRSERQSPHEDSRSSSRAQSYELERQEMREDRRSSRRLESEPTSAGSSKHRRSTDVLSPKSAGGQSAGGFPRETISPERNRSRASSRQLDLDSQLVPSVSHKSSSRSSGRYEPVRHSPPVEPEPQLHRTASSRSNSREEGFGEDPRSRENGKYASSRATSEVRTERYVEEGRSSKSQRAETRYTQEEAYGQQQRHRSDRGSTQQQYATEYAPPAPTPAVHRTKSAEYDTPPAHPGRHLDRSSSDRALPGRPPVGQSGSRYELDGLELTEEEMTFISRDLPPSAAVVVKQPVRDYYPRESEPRRVSSSANTSSMHYASMGNRPPDRAAGSSGGAGGGGGGGGSRKVGGVPHYGMGHDDQTEVTSASSHQYRQQQLLLQQQQYARDLQARDQQGRDHRGPSNGHRSMSTSNMHAPPPPPAAHQMHRSSSQGYNGPGSPAPAPPGRSGSGGGASSKAGWWNCSICTLQNPASYLACDACGMVKGPAR